MNLVSTQNTCNEERIIPQGIAWLLKWVNDKPVCKKYPFLFCKSLFKLTWVDGYKSLFKITYKIEIEVYLLIKKQGSEDLCLSVTAPM